MRNRWGILAVLFAVRTTMAFQFQSVAAVAPLLGSGFNVRLADIGMLIGLYFAPGVAIALPGGAIGKRFGDKATVIGGLLLMIAGGLIMALSTLWSGQIVGRLVAGTGAVVLNVQMTKMLTDWFANREIASAMAIFVNSWPTGLAISLLLLPVIGTGYGFSAAFLAVAVLIALGLILLTVFYQPPPNIVAAPPKSTGLTRHATGAILAAGLIWGLYNVGLATVFSFGPSMLVERGWLITSAGSTISIVLWLAIISIPLGGFLADRFKRHEAILVVSCVVFGLLMFVLPRTTYLIPIIVATGLVCGLAAGPIMSLPSRVLEPGTRAIGMGAFYTMYYLCMLVGPVVAGAYATMVGTAGAAFDFGAATLLACPVILWVFRRITASAMAVPRSVSGPHRNRNSH